jgi:Ca-activated chloride channel family protein
MIALADFHFLRPYWLLALVPAALLLVGLWRRPGGDPAWRRVCDPALLDHLWLAAPTGRARLPLMLLALGWVLAVLALAGPTWERAPRPVYHVPQSLVVVLDLSTSMLAADQPPSRLERARFELTDLLARSREGRTALVVFAGEPHVVTPLTDDTATIAAMLPALAPDVVPAPGDRGAPALALAGELLQRDVTGHGRVLLISDGLDDPAAALSAAHALRAAGDRLSVLAVGTPEGAPVPGPDGGFIGVARLDPAPLRELARAGGGVYHAVTADDADLRAVLPAERAGGREAAAETDGGGGQDWVERGPWLLLPLLLVAALGFRRGWLGLVLVLVLPPPAQALGWQDLWLRQDQQAARTLEEGHPEEAAEGFRDPGWRGLARYRAGDYAAAVDAFTQVSGPEGDYNRGNALARAGRLEDAARAYREALARDPQHADAQANLALVEELLRQRQNEKQGSEGDADDSSPREDQQDQEGQQGQEGQQQQGQQGQSAGEGQQSEEGKQGSRGESSSPQAGNEGDQGSPQPNAGEAQDEGAREARQPRDGTAGQGADGAEQARRDVQRAADSAVREGDAAQQRATRGEPVPEAPEAAMSVPEEPPDEADMAMEQWLRQVPDDPSGLLRRKFMLEHLMRERDRGAQR